MFEYARPWLIHAFKNVKGRHTGVAEAVNDSVEDVLNLGDELPLPAYLPCFFKNHQPQTSKPTYRTPVVEQKTTEDTNDKPNRSSTQGALHPIAAVSSVSEPKTYNLCEKNPNLSSATSTLNTSDIPASNILEKERVSSGNKIEVKDQGQSYEQDKPKTVEEQTSERTTITADAKEIQAADTPKTKSKAITTEGVKSLKSVDLNLLSTFVTPTKYPVGSPKSAFLVNKSPIISLNVDLPLNKSPLRSPKIENLFDNMVVPESDEIDSERAASNVDKKESPWVLDRRSDEIVLAESGCLEMLTDTSSGDEQMLWQKYTGKVAHNQDDVSDGEDNYSDGNDSIPSNVVTPPDSLPPSTASTLGQMAPARPASQLMEATGEKMFQSPPPIYRFNVPKLPDIKEESGVPVSQVLNSTAHEMVFLKEENSCENKGIIQLENPRTSLQLQTCAGLPQGQQVIIMPQQTISQNVIPGQHGNFTTAIFQQPVQGQQLNMVQNTAFQQPMIIASNGQQFVLKGSHDQLGNVSAQNNNQVMSTAVIQQSISNEQGQHQGEFVGDRHLLYAPSGQLMQGGAPPHFSGVQVFRTATSGMHHQQLLLEGQPRNSDNRLSHMPYQPNTLQQGLITGNVPADQQNLIQVTNNATGNQCLVQQSVNTVKVQPTFRGGVTNETLEPTPISQNPSDLKSPKRLSLDFQKDSKNQQPYSLEEKLWLPTTPGGTTYNSKGVRFRMPKSSFPTKVVPSCAPGPGFQPPIMPTPSIHQDKVKGDKSYSSSYETSNSKLEEQDLNSMLKIHQYLHYEKSLKPMTIKVRAPNKEPEKVLSSQDLNESGQMKSSSHIYDDNNDGENKDKSKGDLSRQSEECDLGKTKVQTVQLVTDSGDPMTVNFSPVEVGPSQVEENSTNNQDETGRNSDHSSINLNIVHTAATSQASEVIKTGDGHDKNKDLEPIYINVSHKVVSTDFQESSSDSETDDIRQIREEFQQTYAASKKNIVLSARPSGITANNPKAGVETDHSVVVGDMEKNRSSLFDTNITGTGRTFSSNESNISSRIVSSDSQDILTKCSGESQSSFNSLSFTSSREHCVSATAAGTSLSKEKITDVKPDPLHSTAAKNNSDEESKELVFHKHLQSLLEMSGNLKTPIKLQLPPGVNIPKSFGPNKVKVITMAEAKKLGIMNAPAKEYPNKCSVLEKATAKKLISEPQQVFQAVNRPVSAPLTVTPILDTRVLYQRRNSESQQSTAPDGHMFQSTRAAPLPTAPTVSQVDANTGNLVTTHPQHQQLLVQQVMPNPMYSSSQSLLLHTPPIVATQAQQSNIAYIPAQSSHILQSNVMSQVSAAGQTTSSLVPQQQHISYTSYQQGYPFQTVPNVIGVKSEYQQSYQILSKELSQPKTALKLSTFSKSAAQGKSDLQSTSKQFDPYGEPSTSSNTNVSSGKQGDKVAKYYEDLKCSVIQGRKSRKVRGLGSQSSDGGISRKDENVLKILAKFRLEKEEHQETSDTPQYDGPADKKKKRGEQKSPRSKSPNLTSPRSTRSSQRESETKGRGSRDNPEEQPAAKKLKKDSQKNESSKAGQPVQSTRITRSSPTDDNIKSPSSTRSRRSFPRLCEDFTAEMSATKKKSPDLKVVANTTKSPKPKLSSKDFIVEKSSTNKKSPDLKEVANTTKSPKPKLSSTDLTAEKSLTNTKSPDLKEVANTMKSPKPKLSSKVKAQKQVRTPRAKRKCLSGKESSDTIQLKEKSNAEDESVLSESLEKSVELAGETDVSGLSEVVPTKDIDNQNKQLHSKPSVASEKEDCLAHLKEITEDCKQNKKSKVTTPMAMAHLESSLAARVHAESSPVTITHAESSPAAKVQAESSSVAKTHAEYSPASMTHAESSPAAKTHAESSPARMTHAESSPAAKTHAESSIATKTTAKSSPATMTHAESSPVAKTHEESSPATMTHAESSPAAKTHAESSPAVTAHADSIALAHSEDNPEGETISNSANSSDNKMEIENTDSVNRASDQFITSSALDSQTNEVESEKMTNPASKEKQWIVNGGHLVEKTVEGEGGRGLRTRRSIGEDNSVKNLCDKSSAAGHVLNKPQRHRKMQLPPATGTYMRVRVIPRPWKTPEGTVNRPVLRMMIEGVLLFTMNQPGLTLKALFIKYTPILQPIAVLELLDMLEDIGCVTRTVLQPNIEKPSLFSKRRHFSIDKSNKDEVEENVLIIPTIDCILKMGQFIQQVLKCR